MAEQQSYVHTNMNGNEIRCAAYCGSELNDSWVCNDTAIYSNAV